MANVTDSNSWRMIPIHSQQLPNEHYTARVAAEGADEMSVNRNSESLSMAGLTSALGQVFDSRRDQVVWNLAGSDPAGAPGTSYVRVDAQHTLEGPRPWLVLVEDARGLSTQERFAAFEIAAADGGPWLLVACDADADAGTVLGDQILAEQSLAERLRCDYIGPIRIDDKAGLSDAIERIKQRGHSALLHVRAPVSPPRPHFSPPDTLAIPDADTVLASETTPTLPPGVDTFRRAAAEALAQLAVQDERILVICTQTDALLDEIWRAMPGRLLPVDAGVPHALDWCANLAASGSRPFAFLSQDEAQNNLGMIRRAIALPGAPVTLIVERGNDALATEVGSAALAGIRNLPHFQLLAPKDGAELRQMLTWCADQSDPIVVWLPETLEPEIAFAAPAPIELGEPEVLCTGDDVAILSWGNSVAAAMIAAEQLRQRGVAATVLNCRFAQPLTMESVRREVAECACVLIVDDAEQQGGFAGWMLEKWARQGGNQLVSVVSLSVGLPSDSARAQVIVGHCAWLSAPIAPPSANAAVVTVESEPLGGVEAGTWLGFTSPSADKTAGERAQVLAKQLSADAWRWGTAYQKIGSRDLYLWKWCAHGVDLTTLPSVASELRAHVCDTKLLSIVLCVLLDDVADQHGNGRLLEALLLDPFSEPSLSLQGLSDAERRHVALTHTLWAEYQARVASYPLYDRYAPVLKFDLTQFINTMRYSHLVNERPYLLNLAEHDLYTSHNMMMISFATLDLMCSPEFPLEDVGILREAQWHAQCMGRIGNLLSTWRRELADRDFTSGVFVRAVVEGDLTLDQLNNGSLGDLERTIRTKGHEAYFFEQWLSHRDKFHRRVSQLTAYDWREVLQGHDRFFAMHMGSQGLI